MELLTQGVNRKKLYTPLLLKDEEGSDIALVILMIIKDVLSPKAVDKHKSFGNYQFKYKSLSFDNLTLLTL